LPLQGLTLGRPREKVSAPVVVSAGSVTTTKGGGPPPVPADEEDTVKFVLGGSRRR
jgi:hypothetical protein